MTGERENDVPEDVWVGCWACNGYGENRWGSTCQTCGGQGELREDGEDQLDEHDL